MLDRSKFAAAILTLAVLAATGCEQDVKIAFDGNNPPTFKLSGPAINSFRVTRENVGTVWAISCEPLSNATITYGKVPSGCSQDVEPAPLIEGQKYHALATPAAFNVGHGMLGFTAGKPSDAK
jgi:hypothetical protein